jgi:cellulose synthase (UDP-forming)
MQKPVIHYAKTSKTLLSLNIFFTLFYFSWWFTPNIIGNHFLFYLLFFGEVYHVTMAVLFSVTLWPRNKKIVPLVQKDFLPSVDIFITVAGEPKDIVRKTVLGAKNQEYPNKKIFILNDGFVAKKDNWKDMEDLAKELHVECITRKKAHGAKAGNINNALKSTKGDLVVIFDADMVPYKDFLTKTVTYFVDKKVGFVQTPQYYSNHKRNEITSGSWEQQELFFGPIMVGKDNHNAAFICGTNVVIRREALLQVGGMCEDNIAEDFLTSQFIHRKGWTSHYLPEVFSEGLAPEDLLSYYKQQLRWARGSLEVLFTENPLFKKGMSFLQKLQYLSSGLYYLNGVVVLIDIIMPIVYLFSGIKPVATTTTSFALFFIPFMVINLYALYIASGKHITFRAISFSQSSFVLQIQALVSILLRRQMSFSVTSKQELSGNFLYLAIPHIAYLVIGVCAIYIGISREGLNPSIMTNIAWFVFNVILFIPFIKASYNWPNLRGGTR